jgi:hypothetical protein
MENQNKNFSTTPSTNLFMEWVLSHYLPNMIVYSSDNAKKIVAKNNLTPSEFLRPFGNFTGININFSYGERFTINLKNLKFDFYDSEKFSKLNFSFVTEMIENLLTCPGNYPEWNLSDLNDKSADSVLKKLSPKTFSFPWFQEYDKTILEAMNFNEYEMLQQPLANIYMISVKDDKKEIDSLVKKNIPLLIEEGVYEKNMPSMVFILNEKSKDDNQNASMDYLIRMMEIIRLTYPGFYVLCCEINSLGEPQNLNNDIWSKYIHKLDYYKIENVHYKLPDTKYGDFISAEERENFKSGIYKFFNEYIKIYLQKLVMDLDEEITNNKKGIKNGFLSMFKKGEKIEYINVFNIYKLTPMEKKLYLLSMIQFYFRDYDNAMEHLKILMGDLKSKSNEHYNAILELYTVCHFICSTGARKDVDFESPYNAYLKSKNSKGALRYLLIWVKMLEHLKRFNEIPKMLIRATSEITAPFLSPLLLEKASIYYLLSSTGITWQVKKFAFFQVLAGMSFKSQNAEFKRYTLNCYGNVVKFFLKNNPSFLRSKEFLNSGMGEVSMNIEYFEGALQFFKNCIELSTFKNIDQDQALYIRHFLKSLNSLGHGSGLSYIEIKELNIPDIVNSSLLVIEEQDYDIGCSRINPNLNLALSSSSGFGDSSSSKCVNWGNFQKYTRVDIKKSYINLSESDGYILKNLDNIIENKQNFSDFHSKRIFKANIGNKIYVRFLIKNPLNLNLSISSLRLVCDFIPTNKDENKNENQSINSYVETEEKSILLEKNSSCIVTLSCIPKASGRVVIKGLEVGLYKIALFKHSFYKKNVSELHKYRERSRSVSSVSSSSNLLIKCHQHHLENNPKEICFDIIDDNQDIKVIFPKGKEINIFSNELMLMPVIIKNNANLKIKRFCLFFDDSDIIISKNSHLKNENNVCLADTIFKEIDLPKDKQHEVLVPICPQKPGEFYLKVLIKFEEESKFKEIDVKRFLVKFNVRILKHIVYLYKILFNFF